MKKEIRFAEGYYPREHKEEIQKEFAGYIEAALAIIDGAEETKQGLRAAEKEVRKLELDTWTYSDDADPVDCKEHGMIVGESIKTALRARKNKISAAGSAAQSQEEKARVAKMMDKAWESTEQYA